MLFDFILYRNIILYRILNMEEELFMALRIHVQLCVERLHYSIKIQYYLILLYKISIFRFSENDLL